MIEEKYKTGYKRLKASIVDAIVLLSLLLIGDFLTKKTGSNPIRLIWIIFSSFLPVFYSIFLHYKFGQTIGKWVTGIKVIDITESRNITLWQSTFRDSIQLAVQVFGLLYFIFLIHQTDEANYISNDYTDFTQQIIFWWTIIELVTMLTNKKRRAVHDYLAGSVVIKE